jgi:tetratricopeptide (TPR) repeat protein
VLAPELPEDIQASDLDKEVRSELLSLSKEAADLVARHLVAAGQVIDEDAELAMAHAIAARRMASRIAVVREAVGLAAYAAGDWATAIAELRTYHRMTGRQTHLAEIADSERALGRPERAIDLWRGAAKEALDPAGAIELLIVAAGARSDLGQHDAAVAMLQVRELTADAEADWAARLRYAYADALLGAGRREEAREWFARAAEVDTEELTDAAERLLELDGVTIEGDDEDEDKADGDEEYAVAEQDQLDAEDDDDAQDADDDEGAGDDEQDALGSEEDDDEDEDQDDDELEDEGELVAVNNTPGDARTVAFVDGVESALNEEDDLDDDTADEDEEYADSDDKSTADAEEDTITQIRADAAAAGGVGLGNPLNGDIDIAPETPETPEKPDTGNDSFTAGKSGDDGRPTA